MLIPMASMASSSSTSSPSTEPKKEQKVDIAIMVALQEIPVIPADIKRAIDEQGQGKADLMENLEQVQDDQYVNPELQRVEEGQGEANIEDFDWVTNRSEHPLDLIKMPLQDNPIASSAIKSIVLVVSHEDQVVEVPHTDFIFKDQQWKLEDCT